MKQLVYCFVILVVLSLLSASVFGQNLVVPTLKASGKYLNEIIANDSVAAKAGNRTYVLQRDSVYYVNAVIRNIGWPLRLVAGTSGKYKPSVFFILPSGLAQYPTQMFDVQGNLYMQNIQASSINELSPSSISGMGQNLILTNAQGFDLIIDSCIFNQAGQGFIRTTSAPRVVKVTNSIMADMGYIGTFDPGNGRGIDLRTGSCDSLVVVNNTFVNNGDRVIRHYSSTAPLKYMLFDHNTVVNNYAFHGMMALGITGSKIIITNNFFQNPFALGADTDVVRQAEFGDSGEMDPRNNQPRMVWIQSVPNNDTTVWTIRNNYYSITTAQQNWYTKYAGVGVTGEGSKLTWRTNKKVDSVLAFQKVSTYLTKVPETGAAYMDWYRSPSGANKTKSQATFDPTKNDYNRLSFDWLEDSLNCKYPTTASIYTAADGGKPVGALTWWNMTYSAVEKIGGQGVPETFALSQNYPNPFNPSTVLEYSLSKTSHVVLEVFNVLGQSVARLVDEQLTPGTYKTTFDASSLSSGVYLYQLKAGDFVQAKKMVLMK
jgi:hypothetical protein